jgi:hypothetical protein
LYGCETWPLTLEEENRLRVFENTVLRTVFGPKGEDVTGGWRELHNGVFHNIYFFSDIIRMSRTRRIGWMYHVVHMGEKRNAYKILAGKHEGFCGGDYYLMCNLTDLNFVRISV